MKKRRTHSVVALFLSMILVMSNMAVFAAPAVNNGVAATVASDSISGWPAGPATFSETAVLLDANTGAVLYDKGKDEVRYPASITKIMTMLVAVENSKLDEQVTFTETGIRDVTWDSGNIGMQLGEVMSMKDCLHAAIIYSANEVCAQVAEYIGGSETQFFEMMNQRAREAGCVNTNFANSSGLPDENLYTTAHDMAKIMRSGLQNKTFRQILGTIGHIIPATNLSAERPLHTHLPLLAKESPFYYEGCLGGKTGFTQSAQNTLVVAAEREGRTYVVVSLRCAELAQNCTDAVQLFDYAFNNFEQIEVEGGLVTVPKGTEVASLQMTESVDAEGTKLRAYALNGQFVGSAKIAAPTPTPTTAPTEAVEQVAEKDIQETDSNGETAEIPENQEGLSDMAKFLLVVMGAMILIIVVLLIALSIKNRKHYRRK